MGIFLSILKWLGILLLILLAIALILLLIVLIVPFRYKAAARVDDPETHSEFPLYVFRERSDVTAEVSWLLGIVKVLVSYPSGELITVKVFGRDIGIMKFLKKEKQEPEKEERPQEEEKEEEQASLEDRLEKAMDRIERFFDLIDYIYRVLTGSCGRRALAKIQRRLQKILLSVMPSRWTLSGTVGLADPCLNGRMTGICAMLMPVCDDHLLIGTQWEDYRFDLKAEMEGKIRLGVPVIQTVPLVFDRDCRKLYKKLMRARSRLAARAQRQNSDAAQNGTELAKAS